MASNPQIIRYLKDCYQNDYRGSDFINIFQTRVHQFELLDDFSAIQTENGHINLKSRNFESLKKTAVNYIKEKELFFGFALITGYIMEEDKYPVEICAPLFLYPAAILDNKARDIQIQFQDCFINQELLDILPVTSFEGQTQLSSINQIIEKNQGILLRENVLEIAEKMVRSGIPIYSDYYLLYPVLSGLPTIQNDLEALKNKKETHLELISACGFFLVNKPRYSRGILNELETIADLNDFSRPLRFLLGKGYKPVVGKNIPGTVPAFLSKTQEKILRSASISPLTAVVGPPGTGKSFTIASIAVEHISRGQSVLIASKMDQAVDVIGSILENQLGLKGYFVRGGNKKSLTEIKKKINALFSQTFETDAETSKELKSIMKKLKVSKNEINRLESHFQKRSDNEISFGKLLSKPLPQNPILKLLVQNIIRSRKIKYNPGLSLEAIFSRLESLKESCIETVIHYINQSYQLSVKKTFLNERKSLSAFNSALRAKTDTRQEAYFKECNFKTILKIFPVWLVNTPGISDVLPFQKELFDLAIIDEATQCDLASCLPVFQRAKRVLVVGDPNQLRHLSFLSRESQNQTGGHYGLSEKETSLFDYREKCLMDFILEKIQAYFSPIRLDEHFRSLPPIVAFSNHTFYQSSLKIMSENPRNNRENCIRLHLCTGKRNPKGVNSEEAEKIIERMQEIIQAEMSVSPDKSHSIGILSPFREQIDYIENLINKNFELEFLNKHRILTGTAHSFQGEERDIMLLSLSIDDNCPASVHSFMSKPDILNVSITRAKILQEVFYSFDIQSVSTKYLLRNYLDYIKKTSDGIQDKSALVPDLFQTEMSDFLVQHGIHSYNDYYIAGMPIDLLLEKNGIYLGINQVGYPGIREGTYSLERYQIYSRAKLKIIPLEYSLWVFDRQACIQIILRHFEKIPGGKPQ